MPGSQVAGYPSMLRGRDADGAQDGLLDFLRHDHVISFRLVAQTRCRAKGLNLWRNNSHEHLHQLLYNVHGNGDSGSATLIAAVDGRRSTLGASGRSRVQAGVCGGATEPPRGVRPSLAVSSVPVRPATILETVRKLSALSRVCFGVFMRAWQGPATAIAGGRVPKTNV